MSGWVGEAFSIVMGLLLLISILLLVWVFFTLPSDSLGGLPEAFQYFTGVFTRG